MNQTKLSPPNIVILAAGAVMLIGSFLNFYDFGSFSSSAWGGASGFGVFGIATVVVLCGVVMGAQVGVRRLRQRRSPPRSVARASRGTRSTSRSGSRRRS